MYRIIAYDSPTETAGHVVLDPRINRYISDGKLELLENEIDNLTLTVNQNNYLFGNGHAFRTHIEVFQDDILIFRGRCLDLTREMKDSGQFIQSFVFESIQNYLKDSIQRYWKVQNISPADFFRKIIQVHNEQVPEYKKFVVRNVDVTNSTDNVYYYVDYVNTWETIKDKLLSRLGGYIQIERVKGINYIDYLADNGHEHKNDTPIKLAKNLISFSVKEDPTEIITRLVPLGATIEQDENGEQDTSASLPRVDVKTVNNGLDYINISPLQTEYGLIVGTQVWDDVHDPGILYGKAFQWIKKQAAAKESYTIDALELPNYERFKVSDSYQVINQQVTLPKLLRVTKKSIDFANPNKSSLTIGDQESSLTAHQLENINAAKQANKLKQQINSYANRITSLDEKTKEMSKTIESQEAQLNSTDSTMHPWSNMSVTVLGDSITYGQINGSDSHADPRWTDYLVSVSKFKNVDNKGIAGAKIAVTAAAERIEPISITAESVSGQDMVIVFGGINDFIGIGKGLGDMSSTDVSTFYGALKHIVSTLRANNPTAKLVFITPMKEKLTGSETFNEDGSLRENADGHTQLEYITAIQNVCSFYSLNVINLYNNCDINPYLDDSFFQDGLHPTQEGYRKLGQQIAREINKI